MFTISEQLKASLFSVSTLLLLTAVFFEETWIIVDANLARLKFF